jgi:hypothetical protein
MGTCVFIIITTTDLLDANCLSDSQIVDMAKLQHSLVTDRIMQLQKELDPEIRLSENILMHQQLAEVADDAELLGRQQSLSIDNNLEDMNLS